VETLLILLVPVEFSAAREAVPFPFLVSLYSNSRTSLA